MEKKITGEAPAAKPKCPIANINSITLNKTLSLDGVALVAEGIFIDSALLLSLLVVLIFSVCVG